MDDRFRPLAFPLADDAAPAAASPFPPLAPAGAESGAPAAEQDRMRQLEAMLQEMQGRAEIIEKEAWDKAYAAGEKAGMELGRRRAEQMLAEIEALREALAGEAARLRERAAEAIVDLAEGLARAAIGHAPADAAWMAELARQAAMTLAPETELTLFAPPDALEALQSLLDDAAPIRRIEADPALARGQCRLEGEERAALIDPARAIETLACALRAEALEQPSETDAGS